MTVKVGINGMGRIGRMIVRSIIENKNKNIGIKYINNSCLLYTSPSPRDLRASRMPSSA